MPYTHLDPWRAVRPWERHSLVLLVAGLVYIAIGQSYILTDAPASRMAALHYALHWFGFDISLMLWGWVFVLHGIAAIISARWPPISETWGYFALTGLSIAWALFYLMGVLFYHAPPANIVGTLSWGLIGFMWWGISGLMNPTRLQFVVGEVPKLRLENARLRAEISELKSREG